MAGGNVYILGTTFENTADRLVAYGLSRGPQTFGVVYPSGLEGESARDAVAAAVNAARRDARHLAALQPLGRRHPGGRRPGGGGAEGAGVNAIVLTDGPTGGLAYIADALRGNGLSSARRSSSGMQRWDVSAEAMAVPSLQGGVFAAPDPALFAAFAGRYRTVYGEGPHELAGLAYDGVAAAGALIAQARAQGGSPFSSARLTQPAGFAGVNGPFRFGADGRVQRNLAIIEVRDGQSVVTERRGALLRHRWLLTRAASRRPHRSGRA